MSVTAVGRFTEVAGQRFTVNRPPRGMLAIVDHEGRAICVGLELLRDGSIPALDLIEQELGKQPPAVLPRRRR
jgi:hypothetical protein